MSRNTEEDEKLENIEYLIETSDIEGLERLIKNGIDLSSPVYESVVYTAALEDDFDIVQLLLENGAKPGKAMVAAGDRATDPDIIHILHKYGADVNARLNGDTALILAAYSGFPDVVKALLQYGADVNAHNDINLTALINASWEGHYEIVKELIAHNADVNAFNGEALKNAQNAADDNEEVIKLLIANGAKCK